MPRRDDIAAGLPRRRRRPPHRVGIARLALGLFGLGVVAAGAAGIYAHRAMKGFFGKDGLTAKAVMEKPFGGKKKVFLLVLGVDEKDRLLKTDQRRSDTMILAALDLEQQRVAALSLPRDTRVEIPGRQGHDKLNAAHTYGGAPLVRQTVSNLLGVTVDRFVKTDVGGFRAMVDLIGPIQMDVEKRMDYDDNWADLHIHLKPGHQSLNAEQVMGYVRFRHDATGDMGRMKRQQKFLRALAQKMLTPSGVAQLPQVMETAQRYIETDLTPRELWSVANLFRNLSMSQIATATLPGTPRYMHRVSYYVLDEERVPHVMQHLFHNNTPVVRAGVAVLNGSGLPGIAVQAARRLATAGFHVSRTGNAENYDFETTEVRAADGQEKDARRAATILGVGEQAVVPATPAPTGAETAAPQPSQLVVVLGKDYRP